MTIQGAIAELQNLLKVDDVPFYYKGGIQKVIETIQMDIPKQADDLISRADAIDVLIETIAPPSITLDTLVMRIDAIPSAQPKLDEWCTDCKEYNHETHNCPRWNRVIRTTVEEVKANNQPKTGEWIRGNWYSNDSGFANPIVCSECNSVAPINLGEYELTNYCPNCGARMTERSE